MSDLDLDALRQQLAALQNSIAALEQAGLETAAAPLRQQAATLEQRIQTEGGAVVGDVNTGGGDFVGHDQITVEAGGTLVMAPPPPGADAATLERAYLHWVIARCNRLPLGLIDPKYVNATGNSRVLLSDVYVPLDVMAARLEVQDAEGHLRHIRPDAEPRAIPALLALCEHRCVVLLGDPGSGKSTLLRHLAAGLAKARLRGVDPREVLEDWNDRIHRLPVRVVLRDLAAWTQEHTGHWNAGAVWDFIRHDLADNGLEDCFDLLRQCILAGEATLLFDGLDEVPDAAGRRGGVRDAVAAFSDGCGDSWVVVTCRTYAYRETRWKLADFDEYTLALFDEKHIQRFVEQWYAAAAPVEGWSVELREARAAALQRAARLPHLAPLAERPLLLTLMATLHTARGTLPDDRADLYADCVRLLLDYWQRTKLGAGERSFLEALGLPMERLERALYQVAYQAHLRQAREVERATRTADIGHTELLETLAPALGDSYDRAQTVVRYVEQRAGLLLARGGRTYTFPHRTFQEYLAACHLLETGEFPYNLADLARSDPEWWREVVLLAAGRARPVFGQAVALLNALADRDCTPGCSDTDWRAALLAGQAAAEVHLPERAMDSVPYTRTLERLQGWLVGLLEQGALTPHERVTAGETLALLGDPRPGVGVILSGVEGSGLPDIVWCDVPAGPFWMGSDDRDVDAQNNEKPYHQVHTPAFRIARYPVTNSQYAAFVQATGRKWQNVDFSPEQATHPAIWVPWHDAMAFCEWLTACLRDAGKLADHEVVRLPTEAEWEKAARGVDERIYPWGENWEKDRANTDESGLNWTSPVGCFPGGIAPCGALDMAGNVWEWTHSLYRPYPYQFDDGREDPDAKGAYVARGGSWFYLPRSARCASRYGDVAGGFDGSVGFRVLLSLVNADC